MTHGQEQYFELLFAGMDEDTQSTIFRRVWNYNYTDAENTAYNYGMTVFHGTDRREKSREFAEWLIAPGGPLIG